MKKIFEINISEGKGGPDVHVSTLGMNGDNS